MFIDSFERLTQGFGWLSESAFYQNSSLQTYARICPAPSAGKMEES
jgi:hypothetical protein